MYYCVLCIPTYIVHTYVWYRNRSGVRMEPKRIEVDGIAEGHGYTIRLLFARRHVPEHKDIPPEMNGLRTESICFVSNTTIYLFSPTFSPTKSTIKRLKIYYYRLVITYHDNILFRTIWILQPIFTGASTASLLFENQIAQAQRLHGFKAT